MRITRYAFLLAVFAALATLLFGAAVTGTWKSAAVDNGPQFVFTLQSEGGKVTGTMLGMNGKQQPISDGKLDADNISFSVASEWQDQPITLVVNGKVAGDEMHIHIGTEDGSWGTDADLKRSAGAAK
ncbi:MAG: hypothetical protein ACRD2G_12030 [Terriglobia bacterium]